MQCETCSTNLDSKLNLTQREKLEETGKIVIKELSEGFGRNFCKGYLVTLNGKTILHMRPDAAWGFDYTPEEMICELLNRLGFTVEYECPNGEENIN